MTLPLFLRFQKGPVASSPPQKKRNKIKNIQKFNCYVTIVDFNDQIMLV